MTIIMNQTTRGQILWRSVHLETDITTCSHIAEIDKHCMAITSSQAGQVLITLNYNTC